MIMIIREKDKLSKAAKVSGTFKNTETGQTVPQH